MSTSFSNCKSAFSGPFTSDAKELYRHLVNTGFIDEAIERSSIDALYPYAIPPTFSEYMTWRGITRLPETCLEFACAFVWSEIYNYLVTNGSWKSNGELVGDKTIMEEAKELARQKYLEFRCVCEKKKG